MSEANTYTLSEIRMIEADLGAALDVIDVTRIEDACPMFLITTPRCDYCGGFVPGSACLFCGAAMHRWRNRMRSVTGVPRHDDDDDRIAVDANDSPMIVVIVGLAIVVALVVLWWLTRSAS